MLRLVPYFIGFKLFKIAEITAFQKNQGIKTFEKPYIVAIKFCNYSLSNDYITVLMIDYSLGWRNAEYIGHRSPFIGAD